MPEKSKSKSKSKQSKSAGVKTPKESLTGRVRDIGEGINEMYKIRSMISDLEKKPKTKTNKASISKLKRQATILEKTVSEAQRVAGSEFTMFSPKSQAQAQRVTRAALPPSARAALPPSQSPPPKTGISEFVMEAEYAGNWAEGKEKTTGRAGTGSVPSGQQQATTPPQQPQGQARPQAESQQQGGQKKGWFGHKSVGHVGPEKEDKTPYQPHTSSYFDDPPTKPSRSPRGGYSQSEYIPGANSKVDKLMKKLEKRRNEANAAKMRAYEKTDELISFEKKHRDESGKHRDEAQKLEDNALGKVQKKIDKQNDKTSNETKKAEAAMNERLKLVPQLMKDILTEQKDLINAARKVNEYVASPPPVPELLSNFKIEMLRSILTRGSNVSKQAIADRKAEELQYEKAIRDQEKVQSVLNELQKIALGGRW